MSILEKGATVIYVLVLAILTKGVINPFTLFLVKGVVLIVLGAELMEAKDHHK